MKIGVDFSTLKETRWYECAVRFLFGGIVTVATGLIAKKFGPSAAGLFLAFPAICPATATLVEKHEREKKEQAGVHGLRRGRTAASVDVAGTAMGTLGLIAFGAFVWKLLPQNPTCLVLGAATLLWFAVGFTTWTLRKSIRKRPRKNRGVPE